MIVCVGLAPALDLTYGVTSVRAGDIHRPQWSIELGGGKSLNVARALKHLGVDALAVAPLGGATGDRVAAGLAEEGIPVRRIVTDASTRTCTSAVDLATGAITEFYPRAPALDATALAGVCGALDAVADGWIVVSGSMHAAAVGILGDALERATARGVRIALDVQDEALRALLPAVRPALAKVNRAEATAVVGDAPTEVLACRLIDAGAGAAVVTEGAAGATAVAGGRAWTARPAIRGVYTVGAGDTFLAGLLSVLHDADDLATPMVPALQRATAAAAAGTRVPGAGRLDAADVSALESAVAVAGADTDC